MSSPTLLLVFLWGVQKTILETTVEPPNNGHIGDRSLVLCREVVPFSEVGIEQTRSQTTLCWASLVPRLPRLGCVRSHCVRPKPRYGPSSRIARVAPLCWNGQHSTATAIMCINVRAIVGLSILGGYFMYSYLHLGVRLCPMYGVERLPYLGGYKYIRCMLKSIDLSALRRLSAFRRVR